MIDMYGHQKVKIIMTAIIAIAVLEIIALLKDINGVLFTTVLVVIAALAGVMIPTPKILKV